MFLDRVFDEYDLLARNLLGGPSRFSVLKNANFSVPCNIGVDENEGLVMEFAIVGGNVEDIDVNYVGDTINVKYHQSKRPPNGTIEWQSRTISKKDFEVSWRVSSKFALDKLETSYKAGLLSIKIPFSQDMLPKKVEVKLLD